MAAMARFFMGIGPYTGRAVLAFANAQDVGVVDTNVARILARRAGRRLGRREVQEMADAAVPSGEGWRWNQGMLDLGATICCAASPNCRSCPFDTDCSRPTAGRPDPDPARGSAGVSGGQSKFEGSDRQGRGRLVDALRAAPVRRSDLAEVMGWPDDAARAERVARGGVADGLAVDEAGSLRLP